MALSDLHHRDVLVGADGRLHVLDLAVAWTAGRKKRGWRHRVFRRLCDQDRVALARMRARFVGGDVEAAVAAVGSSAEAWYRRGRRVKHWYDRLRGKGVKS